MGRKRQRKNSKSPKVTPEKCSKKQKYMDAFVQTTNADEMNAVPETVPDSDSDLARDPEFEECEEKFKEIAVALEATWPWKHRDFRNKVSEVT